MQRPHAPFQQTEGLPTCTEMYRALLERDASYEGVFWVGVRTTGIFCRPTCPAKKPKQENVEFFAGRNEALTAGYRACLRCAPMKLAGTVPDWLAGLLLKIDQDPARRWTDSDLDEAGLDPVRVRRWFKSHHDMTFHSYQRARRMGVARGQILKGDDITGTAYNHGFESLSGFRDAFARLFGETPGNTHAEQVVVTRVLSPLGPLIAGATDKGLCLLEFADRPILEAQIKRLRETIDCAVVPGSNQHIEQLECELAEYFAGERETFDVALQSSGSEFQQQVWCALRQIPFGETRSYQEIALAIDNPKAVRAVGRANGENRMPIVIPCHRVVRADGTLGGYGGGLWRKRFLLKLEGNHHYEDSE